MASPIILENYSDEKVKFSDTMDESRKIGSTDCKLPADFRIDMELNYNP